MSTWTQNDIPDQTGRVIVVTGANSGIGYESAVALAAKGATVVMAVRSLDKGEQARKELLGRAPVAKVELMKLDLGDLKSVRAFADAFNAKYSRLDVLMNNAGVMIPPYGKTADGFETQFGTNHLGHFALTGLLLPKLLTTAHSRVVTLSSSAALNARMNFDDLQSEKGYNAWGVYSQSKLANLLFTAELQRRLEAIHAETISVAAHPGWTATNLQTRGSNTQQRVMALLNPVLAMRGEAGARYQLYAATAPDVRGGEFYGPRFVMRGTLVRVDPPAPAKNVADAARLWQISEQLTGVRFAALDQAVTA